jgi:hypothetical protein
MRPSDGTPWSARAADHEVVEHAPLVVAVDVGIRCADREGMDRARGDETAEVLLAGAVNVSTVPSSSSMRIVVGGCRFISMLVRFWNICVQSCR